MPATRKERGKTERYYRMRESVVDIAVELFSKNGYTGTGVADIGEAAGLARGALYYYIGSKDALLAEIHDRVMDPLLREAAAIVELDLSFQTRLRLLSESLLWQIVNRHDHVWVFLHEYRQLQGEYRELFRKKRHRFESRIRDVLADGHRRGQLQGRPREDLELATLAFLNLHNYTYQWLAGHRDMRVEELSAFYCDIFFNGILAEPVDRAREEDELERGRSVLQELRGEKSEVDAGSEA
ncbi:TetR/AcrR family transcriptional regulator [Streptomyces sp. NBC_01451]|uniref:TetR/AcrR family transcriptional regulator n=1 Tax=Streptomyces sp. NBC_01451 TaxID=2903872 RepID=UPI002E362A75|nr:TetR family transcriptional regulator [Streptomyces sp. NBC_01451]